MNKKILSLILVLLTTLFTASCTHPSAELTVDNYANYIKYSYYIQEIDDYTLRVDVFVESKRSKYVFNDVEIRLVLAITNYTEDYPSKISFINLDESGSNSTLIYFYADIEDDTILCYNECDPDVEKIPGSFLWYECGCEAVYFPFPSNLKLEIEVDYVSGNVEA